VAGNARKNREVSLSAVFDNKSLNQACLPLVTVCHSVAVLILLRVTCQVMRGRIARE